MNKRPCYQHSLILSCRLILPPSYKQKQCVWPIKKLLNESCVNKDFFQRPPCLGGAGVNSGFVSSVLGSQLEVRGDEVCLLHNRFSCTTSESVCFYYGGKRGGESFALHLLCASTLCYLVSSSQQPKDEGIPTSSCKDNTKAQRG